MKYILAKYIKNPLDINDSGKTIGVIVQSKNTAKLKFSNNVEALKQYDPNLDPHTFLGLEKALKEILKSNNIIISSPDSENSTIAPTETKFLEDLRRSYQGKQQFSEVKEAFDYPNVTKALDGLYSTFVNL